MVRQYIKSNRLKLRGIKQQFGLTIVEAAIVLPVLIFATLSIIDLSRYLYYQSLVKDSLNQAVRLAESQIGDISEGETPRVAAANGPYSPPERKFSERRAALINNIYSGMLESSGLPFQPFIHVDQIAESKHRMQPPLPFALLPAGTGGWFAGADGKATILTNSHVCPHDSWSSGKFESGGASDDGLLEVYGKLGEYSCRVVDGLKLDPKNNRGLGFYSRLYPFEVVARFTMNGIVLGKMESEIKAAGYLPHGLTEAPPESTPSPTAVPSETPEQPPTASPTPTDTPIDQPTPTVTPTATATATSTFTPTPLPTATPVPTTPAWSCDCVIHTPPHKLADINEDISFFRESFAAWYWYRMNIEFCSFYERLRGVSEEDIASGTSRMRREVIKGYSVWGAGPGASFGPFGSNTLGVDPKRSITLVASCGLPPGAGDYQPDNPRHLKALETYNANREKWSTLYNQQRIW